MNLPKKSSIEPAEAKGIAMRVAGKLRDLGIGLMPMSQSNLLPGQRPGMEYFIYPQTGVVALHLRPGPKQTVDGIKARHRDVFMAAEVDEGRVYEDKQAAAVVYEFSVAQPPTLYLSSLLSAVKPYHMTLGIQMDGTPLALDINAEDMAHVLIAGASGSGKTAAAHSALATACYKSPQLRVLAYDRTHPGLPWLMPIIGKNVWEVMDHPDDMATWIHRLNQMMDSGSVRPGGILVYIDELADLATTHPEIMVPLGRITQIGRNSGIRCLLCTQSPSAETLPREILSNTPVRVVFQVVRDVDSRVASGGKILDAHKLPKPGHAYMTNGGAVIRLLAAMPDGYFSGKPQGQDTVDIRVKPSPRVQIPAPVPKPAVEPVAGTPGTGFVMPGVSMPPAREQTVEVQPVVTTTPTARTPESYTFEERVQLMHAWSGRKVGAAAIQKVLQPGVNGGAGWNKITSVIEAHK